MKVCLVWVLAAALAFQSLASPVICGRSLLGYADQKAYYPPQSPHSGGHSSSRGHSSGCPTPSSGSSRSGSHGSSPSHGGSHGATPSHGGSYSSPPSHARGSGSSTTRPVTPAPSVPKPVTPTPRVRTPVTPTPILTPPSIPNFPPITGTCDFWRTHPSLVWGILGFWRNIGHMFGFPATNVFGGNRTVRDALENTRTDGYGALLREGTASFLNSMASHSFPFTTQKVSESFTASLVSEKAAAAQAKRFRKANEGHYNN